MQLEIRVQSPIFSTETKDKIEICFENLLGFVPQTYENSEVEPNIIYSDNLEVNSLKRLYLYIRQVEIIDAVRRCISFKGGNKEIIISFHKQALYSGKIAIVTSDTSSPLGSVELLIKTKNTDKFLNWLVPETSFGRIIKHSNFDDIVNL